MASPMSPPDEASPKVAGERACVDGNEATTYVAYRLIDCALIYPITPSSPMGEMADAWQSKGLKNVWGNVVPVREMQSEAGAAGALHGALSGGALATTFTASQIAGELLPAVIHVSARAIAGQALSIFGDHSDVMATRATGFCMLSSGSVQECMDMALVSHLAALLSSLPFLHFFDGFRTSHEIMSIETIPHDVIAELASRPEIKKAIVSHHKRALNPTHPHLRGTSQGPDHYFQMVETANPYYEKVEGFVTKAIGMVSEKTGRDYSVVEYYGDPDATLVVVAMGSGYQVCLEAVEYLNQQEGHPKVGVINPRLFRPWPKQSFLRKVPVSVERITVLDRTKEAGSQAEPLYLDVVATMRHFQKQVPIIGGRYGLGSKDFTPQMVSAVFQNMLKREAKILDGFTVGINDDVTGRSLPLPAPIDSIPPGTKQCLFWGLGSDGTVGANKSAIHIIARATPLHCQAYFSYDAHKSGGITVSHLRFGQSPIGSHYLITDSDFVACHSPPYPHRYGVSVIKTLREGGIFVFNTPHSTIDQLEKEFPASFKRHLARRKIQMYCIDARRIAEQVMSTVFFKLSGVIPFEQAVESMKSDVVKMFGKQGERVDTLLFAFSHHIVCGQVIKMNYAAIDTVTDSPDALLKIEVPAVWEHAGADVKETDVPRTESFSLITKRGPPLGTVPVTDSDFKLWNKHVLHPILHQRGDELPVSLFTPGGIMPIGTTRFEKRCISTRIPAWIPEKCTQCNYCSFVCPHAVIRPFLSDENERARAPRTYKSIAAKGANFVGHQFTIQISPMDCTGCEVCVNGCPDKALKMVDVDNIMEQERYNWEYALTLEDKGHLCDRYTLKGSQFQRPLVEFSGACEGCGETPYVKLVTQLFGHRMIISNATGCTSIWGGTSFTIPYCKDKNGWGPAWGNSLFEDNAEYGFGIALASHSRRKSIKSCIGLAVQRGVGSEELQQLFREWLELAEDGDKATPIIPRMEALLKQEKSNDALLAEIFLGKDLLPNVSVWILGGDGWAYDIGYCGVDHVLASGANVNILVVDTEVYSNTGGQASKSTPLGATAKFALGGKEVPKKELGMMAIQYGCVYVANVSLADKAHLVKALTEAEAYNGPSLIVAYAPCIEHGLRTGLSKMLTECEEAVECGYWPLYRYNPLLQEKGENPFSLDSKRVRGQVADFIAKQNRFLVLQKSNPDKAERLHTGLASYITQRHEKLMLMHEQTKALGKPKTHENAVLILYGSETGVSEGVAKRLGDALASRGFEAEVMCANDISMDEMPDVNLLLVVISTCGQGVFPKNSEAFWEDLQKEAPANLLSKTKFGVLGLGDSTYYFFCKTAKLIDARLEQLGAKRILDAGLCDDGHEDGAETVISEWFPSLFKCLGAPEPEDKLADCVVQAELVEGADPSKVPLYRFTNTLDIPVVSNERITHASHNRDFRFIQFKTDLKYRVGDCLAIHPTNDPDYVNDFLRWYGLDGNVVLKLDGKKAKRPELPQTVTAFDLFSRVLDILGKPNADFFRTLAHLATDEDERNRLFACARRDGEFKDFSAETLTRFDILQMFRSAKVPLPRLIEITPTIKPRLYSIASSPNLHPGGLNLLILIDEWDVPSGRRHRVGLCCNHVRRLKKGDILQAHLHAQAIEFPPPDKPLVLAGIGSGLAPLYAYCEERKFQRRQGETIAPVMLYFGNQYRKMEYLLEDELTELDHDGIIQLRVAFSRDDPKQKVYVQHLLAQEDPQKIYDLLVKRGGSVFLCGNRSMPRPCQNSIMSAFKKAGGLTDEQAEQLIVEMFISKRYFIESW